MNTKVSPLITIIIPAYNAEQFVLDAIHSVLEQTYTALEILLVDDCSTDSTVDMVQTLQDSRVQLIKQQHNQGASAARNTGMQQAKGSYIAFLDADDVWHPDFLKHMVSQAISSESDLLHCDAYWEHIDQVPFTNCSPLSASVTPQQQDLPTVFSNPYMATGAMLIKKRVIDQIGGFDTNLATAEDVDFVLRVAEHFTVYHLPTKLVWVRMRENSLGRHANSYADNLNVVGRFLQRQPNFMQQESARVRQLLEDIYYCYLRQLIVDRNLSTFRAVTRQMPWNTLSARSLKLCAKAFILKLLRQGKP